MIDHTYEEIRNVILDSLAGRIEGVGSPQEFKTLLHILGQVFHRQEKRPYVTTTTPPISKHDGDIAREIFWDLFRQGVITLGIDNRDAGFPYFELSRFGKKIIESRDFYFFYDVSEYEKIIQERIPSIDDITMVYLKEAMQAFRVGCFLSCSVMLGVAAEHTFGLLLEAATRHQTLGEQYKIIGKDFQLLKRINRFKTKLESHIGELPHSLKEDIETQAWYILSVIRVCRNESGHPTGKLIGREDAYRLLQMVIDCLRKLYELKAWFEEHAAPSE